MNITRWLIIGLTVFILGIDALLIRLLGIEYSISFQLTKWSHSHLTIPFAFGFLMGHWFAQNKTE